MDEPNVTPAQSQYPNLNPYEGSNGNTNTSTNGSAMGSMENAKNSAMNSKSYPSSSPPPSHPNIHPSTAAQQGMDSVKNSQTYQSLSSGPMADKARTEADKTSNEFSNLASARQTPNTQTVTGQNLTHYHSLFYNLLSWENPRATGISYAAIVLFIFATRYVPLVRYGLKLSYMILGVMAAAELAGKMIFSEGFATKMRPRRYYTVPRETLESVMEDLVELANFFVIEFQRIVFAENVYVTIGAFTTALITYFLVKITPAWGLALLFTTLAYFVPLAYLQNQELIDHHVSNAQTIVSKQTEQLREIASQQTNKAVEASSSAFKTYGARASEMVGQAKQSAVDKGYVNQETADKAPGSTEVKKEDFPSAPTSVPQTDGPTEQPVSSDVNKEEQEPLLA
ncbi:uncharacterized protein LTR77_000903 [Saxophila tyrrhenica]|uniref:Reticulon-like protein n=1 Tax=Saxophila tyrrhenica TaxID=1690608 RepID=A0AAV9PTW2_9PEZI|nr:hypothetical protein LTR77_000903 [Saxophila tyrrhenica]